MKKKIVLMFMFFILVISLIYVPKVYALKNDNYSESYFSAVEVIKKIRKMETADGGLGLFETIDDNTLRATSNSNNLDAHMIKNTEYGAIAILGASDYGKQGSGSARAFSGGDSKARGNDVKASTTGNSTGVFKMYSVTAAGGSEAKKSISETLDNRYFNLYTTEHIEQHIGDGMIDTDGWSGYNSFLNSDTNYIYRSNHYTGAGTSYYTRSVIVCGNGF